MVENIWRTTLRLKNKLFKFGVLGYYWGDPVVKASSHQISSNISNLTLCNSSVGTFPKSLMVIVGTSTVTFSRIRLIVISFT